MPMRDPMGAILRGDIPLAGLGSWTMAAFREAYPDAFEAICKEVQGFESWPHPPWFVVKKPLVAVETDGVVVEDWRAAILVSEAVDYPLENMAESLQFVRRAVDALYGYADRAKAPGLARDARILASALAHAFATAGDDDERIAAGVEQWRLRLSSIQPS